MLHDTSFWERLLQTIRASSRQRLRRSGSPGRLGRRTAAVERLEMRMVLAGDAFGPQQVISVEADGARNIFAADVDGDGDLDMISGSLYDGKVAWYENVDGEGAFGEQRLISGSGEAAWAVSAADLDGDGDLDVLSGAFEDNRIAWYENIDGTGNFGVQRVISNTALGANWVVAADLDRDGDLDVVSSSATDDKVAWYENLDAAGTFGPPLPISFQADRPRHITTADVDQDGDLDVLSASLNDNTVAWYPNDGSGGFETQQVIADDAEGATQVFASDLDGDGDLDVLSASFYGAKVGWYENIDGEGNFGPEQVINSNAEVPRSVFVSDLDRDGDPDVLLSSLTDKIVWHENIDGQGDFGGEQLISTEADGPVTIITADLDGDGDSDVVSASAQDDKIAWYRNEIAIDTQAVFASTRSVGTLRGANEAVAADVDNDGDLDVLSSSLRNDQIVWYSNIDGAGNFGAARGISTAADGPMSLAAVDLDRDGDLDVLSASLSDNSVAWYPNIDGAGNFGTQQPITSNADGAASVFAADLDRDGDQDVLSASIFDGKIAWYENINGAGVFGGQQLITSTADGAASVFAADLDRDGDLDVLAASALKDSLAWYENIDAARSFGAAQLISTEVRGAVQIAAADIDGDGDADVLSASALDDTIAWFENLDGGGTFGGRQVVTSEADGAWSVFAADLDRDGDRDLLSASRIDDTIAWYENVDGQGAFGVRQIISATSNGASSAVAADVDGDGDLDILAAALIDGNLVWYENDSGTTGAARQFVLPAQAVATGRDKALEPAARRQANSAAIRETDPVWLSLELTERKRDVVWTELRGRRLQNCAACSVSNLEAKYGDDLLESDLVDADVVELLSQEIAAAPGK